MANVFRRESDRDALLLLRRDMQYLREAFSRLEQALEHRGTEWDELDGRVQVTERAIAQIRILGIVALGLVGVLGALLGGLLRLATGH